VVVHIKRPPEVCGTTVLIMEHEDTEQKIRPDAESTAWAFTPSPRLR
jgi:hypothetical protein